jgi:sortase A
VVGGIGRVLIATGLLMFGFVAYQLWGTGLEYAQAQDRLEDDFAALLVAAPPPTTPAPTTPQATATSPPSPPTTAPAPVPTEPPATTAPTATVPPFAPGDVMALIEIPSIDVQTYVVSGVQPNDLKQGPGHYPDTPQPGQLGNSAIAGHRTTYGQPFYRLDKVVPGDEIVVTTVQGRFVYRATGSEVVPPGRSDVVATTDPTVARLTLTTCDPKYTATNRLIVYADLDVDASSAPPQAPIVVLDDPTATAPPDATLPGGDDPTVSAASTPTASTPPSTSADPTAPTVPSVATVSTTPSGAGDAPVGSAPTEVSGEAADAFAHGWFSDDAAFTQVALWGFAVSAIAIGAWLLSREVRRNWVGALVGIVPFVIALYFFFQNVNRLLPAAL